VKDALSKDGVVLIAWEHKAILDVHLRSAITGKIGSPVTIRQPQVFTRPNLSHCVRVHSGANQGSFRLAS
jgi:hypothetical protein